MKPPRRNNSGTGEAAPGLTQRDIARRHWIDLADPDRPPSPAALEWLRRVALKMIAADALDAVDRREAIFEASGLKGETGDLKADAMMIGVALRKYAKLPAAEVEHLSAAEFVADRLEWDPEHKVAPDSIKRRILRTVALLEDPEFSEWVRAQLAAR